MYIGVDIGGSKILIAASTDGRSIERQAKFPTPKDAESALEAMIRQIRAVSHGQPITSIVVAAPGALDLERGLMTKAPNLPWGNVPIAKHFTNEFGAPVTLMNDASAAALAEARLGAAQGQRHVLYLTLSTGINAGVVVDGQIYQGNRGIEAGHMIIHPGGDLCGCGGRGHWEAYVSGSAIKRRFGQYGYEITDPAIWETIAVDLALGLFNLITILSPEIVVIGGGVGLHYDRFIAPLQFQLRKLPSLYPLPPIVPAKYAETAVLLGCLALASGKKSAPKI